MRHVMCASAVATGDNAKNKSTTNVILRVLAHDCVYASEFMRALCRDMLERLTFTVRQTSPTTGGSMLTSKRVMVLCMLLGDDVWRGIHWSCVCVCGKRDFGLWMTILVFFRASINMKCKHEQFTLYSNTFKTTNKCFFMTKCEQQVRMCFNVF